MRRLLSILLFALWLPLTAAAQDTTLVANPTEHHDDEIGELLYGDTATGTVRPHRTDTYPEGRVRERRLTEETDEPQETAYEKELAKHQYVDGFRIQVCAHGNTNADHKQARETGRRFKGYFREWRVDVRLITPRWVCLAGDFYTRKEAQAALQRVQSTHKFKSATIVRAKIKNARYKKESDRETGEGAER